MSFKRILFVTGTRADFGKIKPLIQELSKEDCFEVHIFVTGMHMLPLYGDTYVEVEKVGFKNLFKFRNQSINDPMDVVLGKTIFGLSDYIKNIVPDMMVIHGDRVEALAGAAVGALNNILTAHIEGGELSGTIDGSLRHSVTKLSHVHFVANDSAKARLLQLGENKKHVFVIGSPDVDIMLSDELPSRTKVMDQYGIDFLEYNVALFHPVTTEVDDIKRQVKVFVDTLVASNRNYVVIYPNNDLGSQSIIQEYHRLAQNKKFKVFPSMRFECFLTLLKYAGFIIGNSSAGIREAPYFGTPAIDLGSRQTGRSRKGSVINALLDPTEINKAIVLANKFTPDKSNLFGRGESAKMFVKILKQDELWKVSVQKSFVEL
ncbi:UDP-N-acetylglucosamine 2-epimerase [Candidatus Puniceispirillum sp.]|nr:UDP-N-acetylglucosamine 2-epimerase [Candidatus Puniceispirillum sp.]